MDCEEKVMFAMLQGHFPIHCMIRDNSLQIYVLVFMLKGSLSRFHMKGYE
jgi:hypothetical protein